ncbi:hypothetical protein [Streptomyces sp. NPDC058583]|uniref:hypothetical protein n=1 Tax=unclassified Streptomyces TaxID=2593676 RepID=UPI00365513A9
MDTFPPVSGDYTDAPRLPLVTLDEARQAVEVLLHLEDESEEGWAARHLAHELAARLPAGTRAWTCSP